MADSKAQRAQKFDQPGHYSDKDREKIDEADFAGPHKSFPIITQQDVHDAAHLVGHAANPAAVKARIKAIAKRKGFSLPDAWANEDGESEGRFDAAVVTRMLGDAPQAVVGAHITRVDPEQRLVTVTATSEDLDSFGTRFDYEASKKAFQDWIGNVREMHQPKAVGTRFAVHCDDDARRIDCTVRISKGAQDTWEKIVDGTLKGASIGASDVMWEHRREDGTNKVVPIAKAYRLVELSLVDNPSNPAARGIQIVRNALPDENVLDTISADDARASKGTPGVAGEGAPLVIMIEPMPGGGDATALPAGGAGIAPNENDLLAADDPDGDQAYKADVFGQEPAHDKAQLTTPLRPASLTGAESVNVGSELKEPMRPMGGPPPDATTNTFAATRPQGILGSEVRSDAGAGRDLGAKVAAMQSGTAPAAGNPGEPVSMTAEQVFRVAAGQPAIAPYGAGATLPQGVGQLTTRRQRQAEAAALKAARQREMQHAGDNAERAAKAQYGDWDMNSGVTYDVWYRKIAAARGEAERAVLERQHAEDYAAKMAAEGIDPSSVKSPAQRRIDQMNDVYTRQAQATLQAETTRVQESQPMTVSSPDQLPQSWREQIAREYLAQQTQTQRGGNIAGAGTPPTGQMSNSAISQTGPRGDETADQLHGAGAPPASDNPAKNIALVETHGAAPRAEKHRDVTDGLHSHTRTDGTVVEHIHPYMDANHDHVYRNGQPVDVRVAQAEDERGRVVAPMANLAGPVSPLALHPVSGSAQTAVNGQPASPQISAKMSNVGHMDMLNTEDAEATDFGVPGETIVRPTPANSEVAMPAGFHTGGHTPEAIPHIEELSPHNHEVASNLGAAHMGGTGNGGKMDDDLDYDADDDERERASSLMGGRADQAEETRVGARISGESQAAIHAIRDTQISAIKGTCAHCGCDACQGTIRALAHAGDMIGELHGDPGSQVDSGKRSQTALFAEQRILEATITRSLAAYQTQFQNLVQAALAPVLSELETRLADLELTLTDSSQTTRATVATEVARNLSAELSGIEQRVLAPLTSYSQQVESLAGVASGVQAAVAETLESVKRIEAQPAQMAAPTQAYSFPRGLNLQEPGAIANLSETDRAAIVRGLQAASRQTTDVNEQARMAALVMQLQPAARSMLGR